MTKGENKAKVVAIKELLERHEDFVRSAVQSLVQAALEAEMTEALAASGDSLFVFLSSTKLGVPLHADTVTDELATARKVLGIEASDVGEEVVLHGIRHLFKTEMKRLDIPAEVRRRIQSHRSKAATSDMDEWYDHADNYEADRSALERWERRLYGILSESVP